jgi:dUTP pyrophosphatase
MSLYLYVVDPNHRQLQREHVRNRRTTDSGVDLISQNKVLDFARCSCTGAGCSNDYCLPCNLGVEIKTGVVAAAVDVIGKPAPYLLLARSSTSLTPLRMSNQIGLADAGYRGELIARVDCFDPNIQHYTITEGRRLFQIVQHNWLPFNEVILVDSVADLPAPPDNRGGGGFGSTGN